MSQQHGGACKRRRVQLFISNMYKRLATVVMSSKLPQQTHRGWKFSQWVPFKAEYSKHAAFMNLSERLDWV